VEGRLVEEGLAVEGRGDPVPGNDHGLGGGGVPALVVIPERSGSDVGEEESQAEGDDAEDSTGLGSTRGGEVARLGSVQRASPSAAPPRRAAGRS
jgi:hypothetical protein